MINGLDLSNMLNGLDLFSGIGGISLALRPWVKPIAYCENDRYAQCVLLSRMASGELPEAPIWDDVRTLTMGVLGNAGASVDIISGGFPCQDISVAGAGKGLEGSRSGLFFEIIRLARELRPSFLFLENVPALTVRGLDRVLLELTALGYDCRWTIVSAAEVGAPHLRERIWILAHANGERVRKLPGWGSGARGTEEPAITIHDGKKEPLADTSGERLPRHGDGSIGISTQHAAISGPRWWATEPEVGRVAHGVSARVDRIRGLGNAVCPQAAREAFKRLMGLT